jgi:ATP-dependent DNA helicase RecQ
VGQDFRPAYLELAWAAERLGRGGGRPTILAITATATPWVREEIVERLGLRDPLVAARGADRPNLFLESVRVERETDERRVLE